MSLSTKTLTIVGGGNVGSTLAKQLDGSFKDLIIGARDPTKTKGKLVEAGLPDLKVEPVQDAIKAADILILATPAQHSDAGIEALAASLGDVSGKVVIDATNPLTDFPNLEIRWAQGDSGAEVLQKALPDAKVYKAFNTLGAAHMAKPTGKDMMYCGPDSEIGDLVAAVGFTPRYVGPLRYARNLEAIAELWIHCSIPPLPGNFVGNDWTFGMNGDVKSD